MADRAWLWLAPYHDGKARAMAGQPGQSSATGRRRWFLPRPPWLRRALASIGAEETLGLYAALHAEAEAARARPRKRGGNFWGPASVRKAGKGKKKHHPKKIMRKMAPQKMKM